MADLSRTIEIILKGVDQTGTAFKSVGGEMEKLGDSVQKVSAPLASAHDFTLKLNAAMGALAIGGLALAISAATDFDSQFREITTLIDDTGEGVDQFRSQIREYANSSTSSIEDINKALYTAISAGVDYKNSIDFIAQAEMLATAGKADLESTTRVLVSTMNAYGAETEEAGRYSDILFTAIKNGQTTLPEMAQSLSQVTSIAAATGVDFETLAAAIATLTATGMPTAEAMTAIKGALTAILSPTSEAAAMAEKLGIEFGASALASKGLDGVLKDVYDTTGGNVEQINALFGNVRGLTGVLATFGQDGGDSFRAQLAAMQNSTGATATAFDKMADDIKNINQTLVNNFQNTLGAVGDQILGQYGELVGSISNVFTGLQTAINTGAFDPVFEMLNKLGADLTQTFNEFAKNLPEALSGVDFTGLTSSVDGLVRKLGDLFKALFGDIDLSTVDGTRAAIQKVVDVVRVLVDVAGGIAQAWEPWIKKLGEVTNRAGEVNSDTAKMIGGFLALGKQVNVIAGAFGDLGGAMSALGVLFNVLTAKHLVQMVGGFGGAKTAMAALGAAATAAAGPAALGAVVFATGAMAGLLINEYVPGVSKAAQGVIGWIDSLTNFSGTQKLADKEAATFAKTVDTLAQNIGSFDADLSGLREKLQGMGHDITDLPDEAIIRLAAEADLLSMENVWEILRTKKQEIEEEPVNIYVETDEKRIADIDKYLDAFREPIIVEADTAPAALELEKLSDKELEIQAELDIERIKADADIAVAEIEGRFALVQNMLEWRAKFDIAEVEANADKVIAIAGTIESAFESSGEIISAAFGAMGDVRWEHERDRIFEIIEREIELRAEQVEMQKKLTDAEIKWMEARTKALDRGDAAITINGDGLQPHLEAFMWEILSTIQTRVTEEGLDMLLGVS